MNTTKRTALMAIILAVMTFTAVYLAYRPGAAAQLPACEELASPDGSGRSGNYSQYLRDSCYVQHAQRNGDIALCWNVADEDYKLRCVAKVSGDNSICQGVADSGVRYLCYWDAAVSKSDLQACEAIADDHSRNMCLWDIAKKAGQPDICFRLTNEQTMEWCLKDTKRGK